MTNPLATLQVDVARVRLFSHRLNEGTGVDSPAARAALVSFDEICARLHHISQHENWIYPETLRSIADAISSFPIQKVCELAGSASQNLELLSDSIADGTASMRLLAQQLSIRKITDTLLSLSRLIHSSLKVGARDDEPLYGELADLLATSEQSTEIDRQLNEWAEMTRQHRSTSARGLATDLIRYCPALERARWMIFDLIERLDDLLYVPFVIEDKVGICVPIRIVGDLTQSGEEPHFFVLDNVGQDPAAWLRIAPEFVSAVKRGRDRATKVFSNHGCRPPVANFAVSVGLPDLRMGRGELVYDQGSIELPVELALVCQHPTLRSCIRLNPEIIVTGPVKAASVPAKYESLSTVGAATSLLLSSPDRIDIDRTLRVRVCTPDDTQAILECYLLDEDQSALRWRQGKVLTFGTGESWNEPLLITRRRSGRLPLLPLRRHREGFTDFTKQNSAVQLRGLTGIGKTWFVAQWLEADHIQKRYDLILHTSVPEFSASVPEFPAQADALHKWVEGALKGLAERLERSWGRPELARRLAADPRLLMSGQDFVKALQESLAGTRLLWIVDNGQSLLDDDHTLSEPFFHALISSVYTGKWDMASLVFVTNRELVKPLDLPLYAINDGFTLKEALQYLDSSRWRFPHLRRSAAQAVGAHPRALALLVGYASDPSIHRSEIETILGALPSHQGESELRVSICRIVLEHVLRSVRSSMPSAWWTLMAASTFVGGFELSQVERVTASTPVEARMEPKRELPMLERRSLVYWGERRWFMHGLVREYAQDKFRGGFPALHRAAHRNAGMTYFPLDKKGHPYFTPPGSIRAKYADPAGCAQALYHYEVAEYDQGQRAILENYYEHVIPRAQWWMDYGRRWDNPTYGFFRAESLLRKVIQGWTGRDDQAASDSAAEVSADINYLMARALHRQRKGAKYEEAALHYRSAIRKGKREVAAEFVSLLCDLTEGEPENNPLWREAEILFNEISNNLRNRRTIRYSRVGEAFEKVARRYLAFEKATDDHSVPLIILEDAVNAEIPWDGIYLLGSELARMSAHESDVEGWLLMGLKVVPQSHRLWTPYYILKAKSGQLNALPRDLRCYPRGVKCAVSLGQALCDEGLYGAAEACLQDALRTYSDSGELWRRLAEVRERSGNEQGAIKAYFEGIKSMPADLELYMALGQFYERQGKVSDGEKAYTRMIAYRPSNAQSYIALGRLQLARGDEEAALRTYRLGCRHAGQDGTIYLALGKFYQSRGAPGEAETVYVEGISQAPIHGTIYLLLGKLYEDQTKLKAAEEIYAKGLTCAPNDGFLVIALGQLYERQGEFHNAEEVYLRGIEAVPVFGSFYVSLGRLYESEARINEAEEMYLRGIKGATAGIDPILFTVLGQLYERQERLGDAEDIYKSGAAENPAFAMNWYRLVHLQLKRGDVAAARQNAADSMARNPRDGWSYLAAAEVHLEDGDLAEACAVCRRGTGECGPLPQLYELWIQTCERRGLATEATELAREWVSRSNHDGSSYAALASLLRKRGQIDEARQVIRSGLSAVPDCAALLELER